MSKKVLLAVFGAIVLFLGLTIWIVSQLHITKPNSETFEQTQTKTGNQTEAVKNSEHLESDELQAADEIDTSDWKTYRNEEYGFELRYPEECSFMINEKDNTYKIATIDCHSNEYFLTGKIPDQAVFTGWIALYFHENFSIEDALLNIRKSCEEASVNLNDINLGIYFHEKEKITLSNKNGWCQFVANPSQLFVFSSLSKNSFEFIGNIYLRSLQQDITQEVYSSIQWIQ